ncbi:MAG: VOC family protein [Actinobacteria bacterium]|nr:VOC family protein [Actinomycetota bacterium]
MHVELTLDVNDPERMISFWSQVLGYVVEDEGRFDTDVDRVYWSLADPAGRGPRLVIQRVPETVTAKTRVHIDVHVSDIEAATESAVALGAIRVDAEPVTEVGAAWIRLTDPEGNVFCFVREQRP